MINLRKIENSRDLYPKVNLKLKRWIIKLRNMNFFFENEYK